MAISLLGFLLCGLPRLLHAAPDDRAGYAYLEPQPESRLQPRATSIAIRHGEPLEPGSARFTVFGSASGEHAGRVRTSDDARTVFFVPDLPFTSDEWVEVRLQGLRSATGARLPALAYRFQVRSVAGESRHRSGLETLGRELAEERTKAPAGSPLRGGPSSAPAPSSAGEDFTLAAPLPATYWPLTVRASNNPAPGSIFLAPFTGLNGGGRLLVVDDRAMPLFYRTWPVVAVDLELQPNGLLTFWSGSTSRYYAMDSTGTVVDSFATGNGYLTDLHELRLLPDGHALMMAYDYQPYPMDTVVVGGDPNAYVVGLILQELDASKNVVFQWRSWDHFRVTDFVECTGTLTASLVDYVHGNSIELDNDGNLLLSSRHMNEITKIDRTTGAVIWRMGLHAKNNQFTFFDDPRGFSHQHDCRRLPNGHLTLFDNGDCIDPLYSRGLEYEIDEVNHTARLVRVDVSSPTAYGPFMGNVQVHADGGRMIGWGGTSEDPRLTEFHADGSVALEMGFGAEPARWSYRVKRYDWQCAAFTTVTDVDLGPTLLGGSSTRRIDLTSHLATSLTLSQFVVTDPRFSVVGPPPFIDLPPGFTQSIDLRFTPDFLGTRTADLYVRAMNDTSLVARVIHLTGTGVSSMVDVDDVLHLEGPSGNVQSFLFNVRLHPPASHPVHITFQTRDSSATAGSQDYMATSGALDFATGDTLKAVNVFVYGDATPEQNEFFTLAVTSVDRTDVGIGKVGLGVILQDDGTVGVTPGEAALAVRLDAVQPNPARIEAQVAFDLPKPMPVKVEVFDLKGRRVATLADGAFLEGRHAAAWDTRGVASGLYFVRLAAGGRVLTRRVAVTR